MEQNLITKAIKIVGLAELSRRLGLTYQAIRKWEKNNKLPRTEWTGETSYAMVFEKSTHGEVSRDDLLGLRKEQRPIQPSEK